MIEPAPRLAQLGAPRILTSLSHVELSAPNNRYELDEERIIWQ
jgi:hypothetical protein